MYRITIEKEEPKVEGSTYTNWVDQYKQIFETLDIESIVGFLNPPKK